MARNRFTLFSSRVRFLSLNLLILVILAAKTDAVGQGATSNGAASSSEDNPRNGEAEIDDVIGKDISVEYCQLETFNASCVGVGNRRGRQNVVVLIISARYGRMKVGRCVPVDYFTGCSVDALPLIEKRCSGRRECSVVVSNRQLFRVHPCRKDLVAYLEVTYRCIEVSGLDESEDRATGFTSLPPSEALGPPTTNPFSVADESRDPCEWLSKEDDAGVPGPRLLTRSSGYLAASSTFPIRSSPAGDAERSTAWPLHKCPWSIRARPGQRIELTAFDFGSGEQVSGGGQSTNVNDDANGRNPYRDHHFDDDWPTGDLPSSSSSSSAAAAAAAAAATAPIDPCPLIAVFEEPPSIAIDQHRTSKRGGSLRLCDVDQSRGIGGGSTPIYVSASNQLAIRFVTHGNDSSATVTSLMTDHRLYLRYDVIGCPDVTPPPDAWLVRTGDSMLVACNFTQKRWHIVCNGRDWVGSFTNCSSAQQHMPAIVPSTTEKELKQTKKFSYGLLVAVAIGVVIGIAVGFSFLLLVCVCKRRLRGDRKYTAARDACAIGSDTDNDDLYNKSLIAAQMASTVTSTTCDYTVLPQDSMMTSSFTTGRRLRIGDGGVRSPNRAVYVSSADWRAETLPMDGIGRLDMEADDMDRFAWTCDCRLVPVSPPPPPMSSTLPVSGLQTDSGTEDQQHWRNMTLNVGGIDDHRRCTCTSGRCHLATPDCLMPVDMTSYRDSRHHESNEEDCGNEEINDRQRSRIRTIAMPPGDCIQY